LYEYLHKNEIFLTDEQKNKVTDFISVYSEEVFNFESKNIDKDYIKDIISQIIRGITPKPYISPNRFKWFDLWKIKSQSLSKSSYEFLI